VRNTIRYKKQEAHWQRLIEEWLASDEKIKTFCAARKVAVSGFYNWRSKLFPHLKAPKRNIVQASAKASFIPVEIYSAPQKDSSKLVLNMPNGCWITLARDFDVVILQKLTKILGDKNVDVA